MDKKYPKINIKICKSCCACADVCPTTAISMEQIKKPNKRLFPILNQSQCIICKRCIQDCPVNAISL